MRTKGLGSGMHLRPLQPYLWEHEEKDIAPAFAVCFGTAAFTSLRPKTAIQNPGRKEKAKVLQLRTVRAAAAIIDHPITQDLC